MDNCVYLQTEGELVQQSIETQHCCRVVGHCRTSLPAGLGSNVSVYTIHQARATNSKADCGSFKPFHWLKPHVAQGGTAAAAHLRMERGELVTVRSLVAAESQERTAGHHRKHNKENLLLIKQGSWTYHVPVLVGWLKRVTCPSRYSLAVSCLRFWAP